MAIAAPPIIIITLMIASVSALEMAPIRGIISAKKTSIVSSTATWLTILFSDLTPGEQASNTIPNTAGISAVNEGESEER
ncbi:MAG: hypothetical protein AAGB35_05485 [Pseudomonadota bacterium]